MKSILILSALFTSLTVRAGEYLYQAPAATTALGVQAAYRTVHVTPTEPGEPGVSGGGLYRAGVSVNHGIDERFAVVAALTYSDIPLKSGETGHLSGLEPLQLSLRGREKLAPATFLYGLDLQIGLETAKPRPGGGGSRTFGDPDDGLFHKFTATPYLGASKTIGLGRVGAVIAYDIFKANTEYKIDTQDQRGVVEVTSKRSSRSVLTGFYEHQLKDVLLGVNLGWIKQWEIKYNTMYGSNIAPGYGLMRAEVYGNITLTPTSALLPTLTSISTLLSDTTSETDDTRIALAYRQTF